MLKAKYNTGSVHNSAFVGKTPQLAIVVPALYDINGDHWYRRLNEIGRPFARIRLDSRCLLISGTISNRFVCPTKFTMVLEASVL